MGICHTCKDNDTQTQIKAGCGHLVFTCASCIEDANIIRHEKCIVCKGGKTPDQWMKMGQPDLARDTEAAIDEEIMKSNEPDYYNDWDYEMMWDREEEMNRGRSYDGDEEEYHSFNMDFE